MFPTKEAWEVYHWLQDKSPDHWDLAARYYNWDNGLMPMDWIIHQPNCDKATALRIYFNCETCDYARKKDLRELAKYKCSSYGEREYAIAMCAYILTRWKNSGFSRSDLAFRDDHAYATYIEPYINCPKEELFLRIPKNFGLPIEGRDIDPSLLTEEVEQMLNRAGTYFGRKWDEMKHQWVSFTQ